MGASLGAYHAANTLFRYPHRVKRCYALSGVYDLKRFMDGLYDDNFYFHNPVDYMANLDGPVDPRAARELRDSPGHRLRAVGGKPLLLHDVGHPRAARASTTTWTTGGREAATTGRTGKMQMREYLSRW